MPARCQTEYLRIYFFDVLILSSVVILGFIKFLGPYYMLLITKRRKIGAICGHTIYAVTKSEMITIPNSSVQCNMAYSKNEKRSFVNSACKCNMSLVPLRRLMKTAFRVKHCPSVYRENLCHCLFVVTFVNNIPSNSLCLGSLYLNYLLLFLLIHPSFVNLRPPLQFKLVSVSPVVICQFLSDEAHKMHPLLCSIINICTLLFAFFLVSITCRGYF